MQDTVRRYLLDRVLIYQLSTGNILDLPAERILSGAVPELSIERGRTASGSMRTTARQRSMMARIIGVEEAELARYMEMLGCEVEMIALGASASHVRWSEPTRIAVEDGVESRLAPRSVMLDTHVYDAAIETGSHLLEGVPWRGTEAVPVRPVDPEEEGRTYRWTRDQRYQAPSGRYYHLEADALAYDADGDRLWIYDADGFALHRFDDWTSKGDEPEPDATLRTLDVSLGLVSDITYNGSAVVVNGFATDTSGRVLAEVDLDTATRSTISSIGSLFTTESPQGTAYDPDTGYYWIFDLENDRIVEWDAAGEAIVSSFAWGTGGNAARRMGIDTSGQLVVANKEDAETQRIDMAAGTVDAVLSREARALAMWGDDVLIAEEGASNEIVRISDPFFDVQEEDAWELSNGLYGLLDGREGYEGLVWLVPENASVNIDGEPTGISESDPAELSMIAPLIGSRVQLVNATGELDGLAWSGSALAIDQSSRIGSPPELLVTGGAYGDLGIGGDTVWGLRMEVHSAGAPPELRVLETGRALGPRWGGPQSAEGYRCERIDSPSWGDVVISSFDVEVTEADQSVEVEVTDVVGGFQGFVRQDTGEAQPGTSCSFVFDAVGTYTIEMVGQPSFAGVTEVVYDGTDGNILVYDTFAHDSAVFSDLELLAFLGGTGTLQAAAYPASLRDIQVDGGPGEALVVDVPNTTQIIRGFQIVGNYPDVPDDLVEHRAVSIGGTTLAGSTPGGNLEVVSIYGIQASQSFEVDEQGIIDDHPIPKLRSWNSRQLSKNNPGNMGRLMAYMTTWESARYWLGCTGDFSGYQYNDQPPLHGSLESLKTRSFPATGAPTVWSQAVNLGFISITKRYNQSNPDDITPLNEIGKGFTEMILGDDSPDALAGVAYDGLWQNRALMSSTLLVDFYESSSYSDEPATVDSSVSEKAVYALAGLDVYHPSAPNNDDGIVDHIDIDNGTVYQYSVERLSDDTVSVQGDVTSFNVSTNAGGTSADIYDYQRFQDGFQFRLVTDTEDILFEIASATYNSAEDRTEVTIKTTGQSQAWMGDSIPTFNDAEIIGGTFIPRIDK